MARLHRTLLVPGEQVTAVDTALAGGECPAADSDNIRFMFEQEFPGGYAIAVMVTGDDPPRLVAELIDQETLVRDTKICLGMLEQDYNLIDGDTQYELTIVRAANTVLMPAAVIEYNQSPNICPACGATDIYASTPQVDGKQIRVRVECCACQARWIDLYEFTSISCDASDWDGPQQHVRRQT